MKVSQKLFYLILKNYKAIILIWFILLSLALVNLFFNKVSFDTGIGEIEGSVSQQVNSSLKNNFKELIPNNLVITFEDNKLIKPFENLLSKDPLVEKTFSSFSSELPNLSNKDKSIYLVLVKLKKEEFSNYESFVSKLRKIIYDFKVTNKTERPIYVTGNAAFSYDMNSLSEAQGKEAERNVFIFTFIVLVISFSSLTTALIPIISGFVSVIITVSLLKIITMFFNLSIFCQNISSMLGLALSIDYSLLLITRYREEIKDKKPLEALLKTLETAGISIVYSGLTVLIGFIALFIPNLKLTNSIAIGGIIIIFISIISSITLTSLLIFVFRNYLEYPKIFLKLNFASFDNLIVKTNTLFLKNGFKLSLLATIFLLSLALPVLNIKLSDPEMRTMPDTMESKKGFETLQKISNANLMLPIYLIVESKKGFMDENEKFIKLFKITKELESDKRISQIYSLISLDKNLALTNYLLANNLKLPYFQKAKDFFISIDKTQSLLILFPQKELNSFEINALINDLRLKTYNEFNLMVGGPASVSYDLIKKLYDNFIYIILLVYLVTFLLLMQAFKSLLIPIKSIILNTLSILASYGVLVLIFQYGYFNSLINLKYSPESVLSGIPVLLFCIMFSLSMDYEVFLISRIYEEFLKNKDNDKAIIIGISETGTVITKAALLMIVVFSAFIQADIILIKMLGVGLASAVFIDVTIIRLILVPSFMKLAGKLNWYLPKI